MYEYWVFLQVYLELKRMGFDDANSRGIRNLISEDTFRFQPGAHLHLIGDSTLYSNEEAQAVETHLYYEHRFGPNDNFCPDIFIKFIRGRTKTLILDVKYRNYDAQGCPTYESDVTDIAYHKYKQLKQRPDDNGLWIEVEGVEDIRSQIAASFIVIHILMKNISSTTVQQVEPMSMALFRWYPRDLFSIRLTLSDC